ncbi:MAG: type IX secretion system membrane protein PorP/SprF [Bacteroidetes bacterium]|nr:type IX secretion system membrane protein PorP/SprF [Bacteroidota bacterium]
MKRFIYILFGILLLASANAQQLPQYTQYMLNEFAINPAVAGKEEFADVRSNNRYQWVGITDAPRTYMLTVHGPMKLKNMGLGMNLFTDIVGPTRRVGLNFSYAYHIKLNEETKVSLGLSAGVLQWGIDGHKLQLHDAGDENLLTQYQTTYVPDFGAGVLVYSKKYYIGIAVPQMYQSKINLYPGVESKSKLVTHFNVNGAYKFNLDDDFIIEPSFILKYATPAPMKLDVGVRGIYREQVWLGAAYRHNDAVTALVGYLYKNYLMIGYSYDFSTTNIRRYSSGTHEVMLGLRFSRQHNRAWVADK